MNPSKPIGLRERIASAKTTTEIEALLYTGKAYMHPSLKTMRAWQVTAEKRIKELAVAPPPPEVAHRLNRKS